MSSLCPRNWRSLRIFKVLFFSPVDKESRLRTVEAVYKKPREAQCTNLKDLWDCILGGLLHLNCVGNDG